MSVIDFLVNICFLIDIFVTLFSVIENNGKEIVSIYEIFKNYIRGWFFIDILTILPLDLLFDAGNLSLISRLPRVLKFIRITRVFKLN